MSSQEPTRATYGETMRTRRISMPDGRYLIFYTFDDAPAPSPAPARPEVDARPEMTEERDV